LAKGEDHGEGDYHRQYVDEKGRVIREETNHSHSEDYESSDDVYRKEYSYSENNEVESIIHWHGWSADSDGSIATGKHIVKVDFIYENGKVVTASAKEKEQSYDEAR